MILVYTGEIPGVRIRNPLNESKSSHRLGRAGRNLSEKRAVRFVLANDLQEARCLVELGKRLRVALVRVAPRPLDDDGLAAGFKAVRDAIAEILGVDDSPSSPVTFVYGQRRGRPKTYSVDVEVHIIEAEACPHCGRGGGEG